MQFQARIVVEQITWRTDLTHYELPDVVGAGRKQLADFRGRKRDGRIGGDYWAAVIFATGRKSRRHVHSYNVGP